MRKIILNILRNNVGNCYTVKDIYDMVIATGYTAPRGGRTLFNTCSANITRLHSNGHLKRFRYNGAFIYTI